MTGPVPPGGEELRAEVVTELARHRETSEVVPGRGLTVAAAGGLVLIFGLTFAVGTTVGIGGRVTAERTVVPLSAAQTTATAVTVPTTTAQDMPVIALSAPLTASGVLRGVAVTPMLTPETPESRTAAPTTGPADDGSE